MDMKTVYESTREVLDEMSDENEVSLKQAITNLIGKHQDIGVFSKAFALAVFDIYEPEEAAEMIESISNEFYELAPEDGKEVAELEPKENEESSDLDETEDENGLEVKPKEDAKTHAKVEDEEEPEDNEKETLSQYL